MYFNELRTFQSRYLYCVMRHNFKMAVAFDVTESSYYIHSESHAVNKAYAFPSNRYRNFVLYLAQCLNLREFRRISCISVLFLKYQVSMIFHTGFVHTKHCASLFSQVSIVTPFL